MHNRAAIRARVADAVFAAICCAAPLLVVGPSLAGLGEWLADAGLVVFLLMVAGLGLLAWSVHHSRAKAAYRVTKNHKEGVKP